MLRELLFNRLRLTMRTVVGSFVRREIVKIGHSLFSDDKLSS